MNRHSFTNLYPITSLLLLLNVGFYIMQMQGHDLGAIEASQIRNGEYWRLISGTFMHGPYWHIAMNCLVLLDLGRFCEPLLSKSKFFSIYMLSALGGSIASYTWSFREALQASPFAEWIPILFDGSYPANPVGPASVGCSGALAGLVGMMLVYSIKERNAALRSMLVRWLLMIAAITVVIPFIFPIGIDHRAHIGGLLTGGICGLTVTDYATSETSLRWRIPAGLTGLVLVAGLGKAVYQALSN